MNMFLRSPLFIQMLEHDFDLNLLFFPMFLRIHLQSLGMQNYVTNICFLLPLLIGCQARNIFLEIQGQIAMETLKQQAATEVYAAIIGCVACPGIARRWREICSLCPLTCQAGCRSRRIHPLRLRLGRAGPGRPHRSQWSLSSRVMHTRSLGHHRLDRLQVPTTARRLQTRLHRRNVIRARGTQLQHKDPCWFPLPDRLWQTTPLPHLHRPVKRG